MSWQSTSCILVMPCYNEALRLDPTKIRRLVEDNPSVGLICVDDGSTDSTGEILQDLALHDRIQLLTLGENRGKAEAVRQGLLRALESEPGVVGFFDADLATPIEEIARLSSAASLSGALVILGARVQLLGHHVHRKRSRHYLGRLYATVASIVLELPIYDTQAGAKFFVATPVLQKSLSIPFQDQWSFDVELLGRMIALGLGADQIREVPLRSWSDVGESKVRTLAALRSLVSLFGLRRHIRRFMTN